MRKTKARISPNHENVWDLGREWEMSGNSFFFEGKRKGENHPFLAMANFVGFWETTGIIEKMNSLVILDPC